MKYTHNKTILFALLMLFFSFQLVACGDKKLTDEQLQQQLTDTLQANTATKDITVAVAEGVVTLTGQCEGENCVAQAEEKVKEMDGVKSVENNVTMAQQNTDLTLRTQVQSIISKYEGIQADVANGVVVLRGSISRSQLQPLMTELSTLQAAKIDNQLAVH